MKNPNNFKPNQLSSLLHKDKHYQIIWLRRDLRLHDHAVLSHAASFSDLTIIPIFIFDSHILKSLDAEDRRVSFIDTQLAKIRASLHQYQSDLFIFYGKPEEIFAELLALENIQQLVTARDYEPYARIRDKKVIDLCKLYDVSFESVKDHVIFEPGEILTGQNSPYKIYTPFSKNWLNQLPEHQYLPIENNLEHYPLIEVKHEIEALNIEDIGFIHQTIDNDFLDPIFDVDILNDYEASRDLPSLNYTSLMGIHLRFGTVGTRQAVQWAKDKFSNTGQSNVWLKQLIWRDFFFQILWYYPDNVKQSFNPHFRNIAWRNDEQEFQRWCQGMTGYPIVDAGMRQLNNTGYMHNRVRMIVASFLCKHLLIDWRWGEEYFAKHLLDFELAANNGNWQWAAGTGCDAAPYFRVFNPSLQQQKFDKHERYITTWLGDYQRNRNYPTPIVEHKFARERALDIYNKAKQSTS